MKTPCLRCGKPCWADGSGMCKGCGNELRRGSVLPQSRPCCVCGARTTVQPRAHNPLCNTCRSRQRRDRVEADLAETAELARTYRTDKCRFENPPDARGFRNVPEYLKDPAIPWVIRDECEKWAR